MRQSSFLTSLFLLSGLGLRTLSALLASGAAHAAIDENRLWLPRTHVQLRPDLLAAAQFAEQSEECVEVLSGELDSSRSTEDAPVFRIVCRNEAGFTYGVRVQNAGAPNAELEKVMGARSAAAVSSHLPAVTGDNKSVDGATDEEAVLRHCEETLRRRTSGMAGVTVDLKNHRRTTAPDGTLQYDIDFETKDSKGASLLFWAACLVGSNAAVKVELHPRQKTSKMPGLSAAPIGEPAIATGVAAKAALKNATVPADAGVVPAIRSAPVSGTSKPQPDGDDGWEVIE